MNVISGYLVRGLLIAILGLVVAACASMTDSESRQYQGIPPADFVGSPILGQDLFAGNCSFCHGKQMQGTLMGPSLKHEIYQSDQFSDQAIYRAIKLGVRQRNWRFGSMPAKAYISPQKAAHIVAYIRESQQQSGIR